MSAEERQSDLAVMDSNEYKNKTRLESILTQRQQVFEARNKARDLLISGDIQPEGRDLIVLNAVRQYLEEVWNLLLEHAETVGGVEKSQYLCDWPLGTVTLDGREDVHINGLWDFLHCQRRYTMVKTETVSYRHGTDQSRQRRETRTVPVEVSRRAFRLINQFLNEQHDLDIQFEELDDSLRRSGPDSYETDPSVDTRDLEEVFEEHGINVDMRAAVSHGDD